MPPRARERGDGAHRGGIAAGVAGLNMPHLNRILIVLVALSLALVSCGTQVEPDPNAFHPRYVFDVLVELGKTVWQLLLDPETRWIVILLLIGIFVGAGEGGRRYRRRT